MRDKLIEGRLVTVIVGSVFRVVEIFVRAIHITVRGLRLLVQEFVTSPIDARISRLGKRRVTKRVPVEGSSIVLIQRDGEYTGDLKYIAQELLRRGAPYKITWVLHNRSVGPFPRPFRFVRYGTADYFRAIAGARVVIQDGRSLQDSGAVKGPRQYWLQTWHESLGLIASERSGGGSKRRRHTRQPDRQIDFLLTNSAFEREVLAASYRPGTPALMLGHARNDLLLDTREETAKELRKKVLDRLDITDRGQRFLLYAPAHGDNPRIAPLSGIDFGAVRAALAKRFGGSWEILIRTRAPSKAQSDRWLAGLPASCHNASSYPDVQELLVVADAGMTDRSGWICDYFLTGKPAFLFSTRPCGARRVHEGAPLAVTESNRELLSQIEQFDPEVRARAVAQFLERCGSVEDGRAASRTVDKIAELMAR